MRFAVHTGLFRAASSDEDAREAAVECVRAYRENLSDYSKKSPLEVWYDRLDIRTLTEKAPNAGVRKLRQKMRERARQRIGEYLFPKISAEVGGRRCLIDQPPILAIAYADQTKRDHAALVKAVKAGRVEALVEEDL